MTPRERLTVDLFNENRSVREIAAVFGLRIMGVYARLHRARKKCPDAVCRRISTRRARGVPLSHVII